MSIVKFSPIALNFGYDFVLLVHFLGHPVYAQVTLQLNQLAGADRSRMVDLE